MGVGVGVWQAGNHFTAGIKNGLKHVKTGHYVCTFLSYHKERKEHTGERAKNFALFVLFVVNSSLVGTNLQR